MWGERKGDKGFGSIHVNRRCFAAGDSDRNHVAQNVTVSSSSASDSTNKLSACVNVDCPEDFSIRIDRRKLLLLLLVLFACSACSGAAILCTALATACASLSAALYSSVSAAVESFCAVLASATIALRGVSYTGVCATEDGDSCSSFSPEASRDRIIFLGVGPGNGVCIVALDMLLFSLFFLVANGYFSFTGGVAVSQPAFEGTKDLPVAYFAEVQR